MKKLTYILGLMLAAASVHAQVDIKITGSTAFRSSMFRAITNLYGANLQNENPGGPTADNSNGNRVTYRGTIPSLFGSQVVTVYTDMGGSIQGVHSLVLNDLQTFFVDPTNSAPDATNVFTAVADLAFSDVFQNSTVYQSPALKDLLVAVQPFAMVRNVGSGNPSGSISNITSQQLKTLLGNGAVPLSYFTGNTNDNANTVYLPGRSEDSGTRLTMDLDTGFGPSGYENYVYDVTPNGTWFLSTNNPPGFSSGSGVVGALANTVTTNAAIGYLGLGDTASAVFSKGCTVITYNGGLPYKGTFSNSKTFTNDYTPVIMGQYSYWSYEHLLERSGQTGNIDTYRTALKNGIDADVGTILPKYNIRLSEMKVSRPSDGGPISP